MDGIEGFVFFEEGRIEHADVSISEKAREKLREVESGMSIVGIPVIGSGKKEHPDRGEHPSYFLEKPFLLILATLQMLNDIEGKNVVELAVGERKKGTVSLDKGVVLLRYSKLKYMVVIIDSAVPLAFTCQDLEKTTRTAPNIEYCFSSEINENDFCEFFEQRGVSGTASPPVPEPFLIGWILFVSKDFLRHIFQRALSQFLSSSSVVA